MDNIYPFYIVCGFNSNVSLWMPLKCYLTKDYAIRYCKSNKYSARYPWQRVYLVHDLMIYENGFCDQEGFHENYNI